MSTPYTIFGASGFIGHHISRRLVAQGQTVRAVTRDCWPADGDDLGHVIYAIGMTANFRSRVMETFAAQIERLYDIIARQRFTSLLYLSSTRVYRGAASTEEDAPLIVRPLDADDT